MVVTEIAQISSRAARRVVADANIPLDVVRDFGHGVVAVPWSYRDTVMASYPSNVQYVRWLERRYCCWNVPLCADGSSVWMFGPDSAFPVRRPSIAIWADDNVEVTDYGVTSALASAVARMTGRINGAGELENDGGIAFPTYTKPSVAVRGTKLFDRAFGPLVTVSVDPFGGRYNDRHVGYGGLDGATPTPVTISWPAVVSVSASVAPPGEKMLLISGPPVLSWGEVGYGVCFFFATATDCADVMQHVVNAAQPNDRARAQVAADQLRARGNDLFGWVKLTDVSPYRMMAASRKNWSQCASADVVSGDLDFKVVNERIGDLMGRQVYGVVSGIDVSDDVALLGVVDKATDVVVSLTPEGYVELVNCRTVVALEDVVGFVRTLRVAGAKVRLGRNDLDFDRSYAIWQDLIDATSGETFALGEMWSASAGDRGAVGSLVYAAACKPPTEKQLASVRVFTNPLMMESLL